MTAIAAWLSGSTVGRHIAAGLAIAVAILAALAAAFSRGKTAAVLTQQAQASKAVAGALRTTREVQALPPAERRARLKEWAKG